MLMCELCGYYYWLLWGFDGDRDIIIYYMYIAAVVGIFGLGL